MRSAIRRRKVKGIALQTAILTAVFVAVALAVAVYYFTTVSAYTRGAGGVEVYKDIAFADDKGQFLVCLVNTGSGTARIDAIWFGDQLVSGYSPKVLAPGNATAVSGSDVSIPPGGTAQIIIVLSDGRRIPVVLRYAESAAQYESDCAGQ